MARSWMIIVVLALSATTLAAPPPILPPEDLAAASAIVEDVAAFIMTTDVGSGFVKGFNMTRDHLTHSIFINGNLARVLLGAHRLKSNETRLREGLRWCESFVNEQVCVPTAKKGVDGGYWGVGYPTSVPWKDGDLYLGDTGTAVVALAQCAQLTTDAALRGRFMHALRLYDNFVRFGCTTAGCGYAGRGAAPALQGFINASAGGAVGCGYYKGHLSTCPYVVATGTTGAGFEAELMTLLQATDPEAAAAAEKLVTDAVAYMTTLVSPENGTIPYVIDCEPPTWTAWPLDTMTYVVEGLMAAWLHMPKLRPTMLQPFVATAEWLLKTQNADGSWGVSGPDQLRSPRVTSLFALLHVDAVLAGRVPDPRWVAALKKYVAFVRTRGKGAYGVEQETRITGFVGLAMLDLVQFGSTFLPTA